MNVQLNGYVHLTSANEEWLLITMWDKAFLSFKGKEKMIGGRRKMWDC